MKNHLATQLSITFADVDADVASTITALTPNDLLRAQEYAGSATATSSGSSAPTVPSGSAAPRLTVLGQLIRVSNTSTNAIATFSFSSPQTFVRINYQNGVGSGSGGVGATRIAFEAVPEPSTLAALLLSAAALLRRRR